MSRHRYVFRNDKLVELDLNAPLPPRRAPYIMSDIKEYRSTITREPITSRSQHREHLRMHGCVEVGNDFGTPTRQELPPVREDIIAAVEASPERHAEARVALNKAGAAVPVGELP